MAQEDPSDAGAPFGKKLLDAGKKLAAGEDPGDISATSLNFTRKVISESRRLNPSIKNEEIFASRNLLALRSNPRSTVGKLTAQLGVPPEEPAPAAPRGPNPPELLKSLGAQPIDEDPFESLGALPVSGAETAGLQFSQKLRTITAGPRGAQDALQDASEAAADSIQTLFAPEIDLIVRSATERKSKADIFLDAVFPFRTFASARREEEKLWGVRSRFGSFLTKGYQPLFDYAQSVAPVEEGEQDSRAIAARGAIETAGEFLKGVAEITPVTPLEIAEMYAFGATLGAAEGAFARQFPRLFAFLNAKRNLHVPLSVRTQVNTTVFRIKRFFGIQPETPMTVQDIRILSEAMSPSEVVGREATALRANLKRQGISDADFKRADTRLRDEAIRQNVAASDRPALDKAVRKAQANPEETLAEAVEQAVVKEAPAPPASPIRSAAFFHKPSGQVVETGRFHDPVVLGEFARENLGVTGTDDEIAGQVIDGFMTQEGQFLNRQEASDFLKAKEREAVGEPVVDPEQEDLFKPLPGGARALRPLPAGEPFQAPAPPAAAPGEVPAAQPPAQIEGPAERLQLPVIEDNPPMLAPPPKPVSGTPASEAPAIFKDGSITVGRPGFESSIPAEIVGGLGVHPTVGLGAARGSFEVTHAKTGRRLMTFSSKQFAQLFAKKLSRMNWDFKNPDQAPPGQIELVQNYVNELLETSGAKGLPEMLLLLKGDPFPPVGEAPPRHTLEGPAPKQIKEGQPILYLDHEGTQRQGIARGDAEPGEPVEVDPATDIPTPVEGDLVTVKMPDGKTRPGTIIDVDFPDAGKFTVEFRESPVAGGVPILSQRTIKGKNILSVEKPIRSEPVLRTAEPEPAELIKTPVRVEPEVVEPAPKVQAFEFAKGVKKGARVLMREGVKDRLNINGGVIKELHPQTGEVTVKLDTVTVGEPFVVDEKVTLPAADFVLEGGAPLTPTGEPSILIEEPPSEPRKQTEAVEGPGDIEGAPPGAGRAGEPGSEGVLPLEGAPAGGVPEAPGAGGVEPGIEGRRGADVGETPSGDPGKPEGRPERVPGLHERVGSGQPRAHTPTPGEPGPGPGQTGLRPTKKADLNHQILPEDNIGEGGKVQKYKENVGAIRLLKKLEADGLIATPEQKKLLARYVGWGGIAEAFDPYKDAWTKRYEELQELLTDKEYQSARASTPNAHYTSFPVIQSIYEAVERLGLVGGRILEPSMGTGNFFGIMPRKLMSASKLTGVELDSISGRISGKLYPGADVRVMGFEDAKMPDNFYDMAISNVPFGDFPIPDKAYSKTGMTRSIHNYFFAKSLDKVRPGGLVVFITSRFTMDSKSGKARRYIEERAELVDAFRLPETAFAQNAQTSVVTDLLIFRKKVPGAELPKKSWLETKEVRDKRTGEFYQLNEYFAANKKKMLGKPVVESKMFGSRTFNLKSDGREIGAALREAFADLPEKIVTKAPKSQPVDPIDSIPVQGDVKEGGLDILEGKVMRRTGDMMVPVPSLKVPQIKGLLKVRDTLREVQKSQLLDQTDAEVKKTQKELSKSYDSFVKKYGNIQDRKNLKAIDGDPDAPLLRALEVQDPDTGKLAKADIFTKRVISPSKKIEKVDTSKDALIASLNEKGRVDLEAMSVLSGRPVEQIITELKGIIFKDPEGTWVQASAYLSGNVRKKLDLAVAAAKTDKAFKDNVEALKAVQPKDLEAGEIEVNLGAPWIFPSAIDDFVAHLTGESGSKTAFVREVGSWVVDVESHAKFDLDQSVGNNQEWGTRRYPAVNIVRDTLQGKVPTVYETDPETKKRSVNPAETAAARDKQELIKEEFKRWLFEDRLRREALVSFYNQNWNNYRPAVYDGSHLKLPGANPAIEPRPHQKNAVWRVVSSGKNGLLAHVVGAGKTFTVAWAAMEMRRMGLRKKPMIAVPNHLLGQWEDAFSLLYPGARIMTATENDFTPARRQLVMSRIATGDWDAVIVPHTSFQKIPMSTEFQEEFFNKKIAELESAIAEAVARGERKRSPTVKQLEKAKKRLEARLKKALNVSAKDITVTFEELGVDQLFVDESQAFKKLFYASQMTRLAGLSDPAGSQRAFDMFMKTRYLDKISDNAGTVFATGTPITNTIGEMFHVQQYLQEGVLEENGINSFDAWAAMFGETVTKMELATEGGNRFVSKTRFARFVNIHDLLNRYMEVADIRNAKDLGLPRPKVKGGKPVVVTADASDALTAFIKSLGDRADLVKRGQVDPSKDNMLKISTDGRKAAVDMRLIEKQAADFPDSKINKAVAKVFDIWEAGKSEKLTQVVFLDIGTPKPEKGKLGRHNVYSDMKKKLVARGIPASEIVFIHDIKNSDKKGKKRLFEKVNRGEVRILFGSTGKMGTGMNVQRRLKAMHQIDAPWRPDEVEQREGRILRQGNMNAEVELYRYVTIGSFDVNLWQILENKGNFISQIEPGKLGSRSVEDISDEGVSLSAEEVKAIATGDPRIKAKVEVEVELRKIQSLETAHRNARFRAESDIAAIPSEVSALKAGAKLLRADRAFFAKSAKDDFSMTVKGNEHLKREDAGQAIVEEVSRRFKAREFGDLEIGTFRGKTLRLNVTEGGLQSVGVVGEAQRYSGNVSTSGKGTIQSLESQLTDRRFEGLIGDAAKKEASLTKRLDGLKETIEKPFPKADKLKELEGRKARLDRELGITKSDPNAVDEGNTQRSEVDQEGAAESSGSEPEEHGGTPEQDTAASMNPPKKGKVRKSGVSGRAAAEGPFLASFPTEMGGMGEIKPLEMPELVKLARELLGDFPKISRRLRESRGLFKGAGAAKQILLNPEIFKEPQEAAAVLAHELGHLIDYLPDETLSRGNLVGRLLSMRKFMKGTFGDLIVTNKELRAELIAVSEMWRPYDKEKAPESYIAYRNSARELYADALSVLLNTPGTLERLAPKFYRAFFDNLDKKQGIKSEYFKLQDLVSGRGADLAKTREQDIREMFQKGEELTKRKVEERQLRETRLWERLRQDLDNINAPILKKVEQLEAQGILVPDEKNPKFILQEASMAENDVFLLLDRINSEVTVPLKEAGLTIEDLGLMLFLDRILGDRSGIANPLGQTPTTAAAQLENLQESIGPEKFVKLRQFAQKIHDINFEIVEEAVRLGTYNEELFNEKIKPNKNFYASFQVLDFIDDFVAAGVKAQIGTLREIGNPAVSTILKMVSLTKLNVLQTAKISTKEFLLEHFPSEIERAAIVNPGDKLRQFRRKEGFDVLTVLENGRQVGYYVDPYIAKSFEKKGPDQLWLPVKIIRWINTSVFYPLFITYNPGFAFAFNPIRDVKRTLKAIPDATLGGLLREMWKAWPTARKRAVGISDERMTEMLKDKSINVPYVDFILGEQEDGYARLLAKSGILPNQPERRGQKLLKPLTMFLEGIRVVGSAIEALPKIAGYNLRKQAGEKGKSLAHNTRNFTGTPNWLVKGRVTQYTNAIFMFSNIFKEGMKTGYQLATQPRTRSGWWWKTAEFDLGPKFLMFLASIGVGGKFMQDFYDRVSEYDKTNYVIIPMGIQETGSFGWKAVYLRIPHDEETRLVAGTMWKMLQVHKGNPDQMAQILDFGAGQLPNVAPSLTITAAWRDYLTGRNPYDAFRGRKIIAQTEWKAGGWPRLKKMVQWTTNQTGLFRFATYDTSQNTWFETFVQTTPLVNRLIRVSDYGMTEKINKEVEASEKVAALFKLQRGTETRAFKRELFRMGLMKRAGVLSPQAEQRLRRMQAFDRRIIQKLEKQAKNAVERGDEAGLKRSRDAVENRVTRFQWRGPL